MKLWEKGYQPNQLIESFTVGKDPQLDLFLLPYDIQGSKAHAEVLLEAGLLTSKEKDDIVRELENMLSLHGEGAFEILREDEDGHTAIEKQLTHKLGDTGKKIHTGRSRNDQVLTAIRLFTRDQLCIIRDQVQSFREAVEVFSDSYSGIPMPGYTHTRRAMPYSVSQWARAFGESLSDDLISLDSALMLVDKNPLGTGAGYGVNLPLNRHLSAEILNFSKVIEEPMYAQNSRGKTEAAALFACVCVLSTLNRWASDLILFTGEEFAFFDLDDQMTTGSSIMPHKKNPDVLELIRATVHQVTANLNQVQQTALNLMSGYHRDLQLTKEPLINGLQATADAVRVSILVLKGLKVNSENLQHAMHDELYSVDKVYDLVRQGIPFREAYQRIAKVLFGS